MDEQPQGLDGLDPEERMMAYLEAEDGIGEEQTDEESAPEPVEASEEEQDEQEAPQEEVEYEEITWNGETKRLTKDELKSLAQQGFDYTQKTQALSDVRRQIEAQAEMVRQQAQMQSQYLEQIAEAKAIESQLTQYSQVNWLQLAEEDPVQYLKLNQVYRDLKDAYQGKVSEIQNIQQKTAAEQERQRSEVLALEAQAMLQAIPEWKDETRKSVEMAELKSYLLSAGYTDTDLSGLADHKAVVVARKAMLYDKMQKAGKQKVASAPPMPKPGNTAKNQKTSADKQIRDALRKTGRDEYAAKLIERML